jgi:hypothetical protein
MEISSRDPDNSSFFRGLLDARLWSQSLRMLESVPGQRHHRIGREGRLTCATPDAESHRTGRPAVCHHQHFLTVGILARHVIDLRHATLGLEAPRSPANRPREMCEGPILAAARDLLSL